MLAVVGVGGSIQIPIPIPVLVLLVNRYWRGEIDTSLSAPPQRLPTFPCFIKEQTFSCKHDFIYTWLLPLPPFCAVTWLAGARAAVRETRALLTTDAMTDHGRETAEHSVELFYHSKQKYCSAATWKYINRIVKSVSISDAGPEFIGTGSKPNSAVWHTRNRKTRLQDKYLQENYCYFFRQLFTFLTILYIFHTEHNSSGQ